MQSKGLPSGLNSDMAVCKAEQLLESTCVRGDFFQELYGASVVVTVPICFDNRKLHTHFSLSENTQSEIPTQ